MNFSRRIKTDQFPRISAYFQTSFAPILKIAHSSMRKSVDGILTNTTG